MVYWIEKNNWLAWILTILLAAWIFYVSTWTFELGTPSGFPFKAITYHIGAFFLLALFMMIASSRGKKIDWIFFSLLFAVFYSITDELHQYFVPGRDSSLRDILLDSLGAIFAFLIYYISIEWRNGKTHLKWIKKKN
ncbi:MAG: VanZ family protein [Nanoarchaeota archaeon]